MCRVKSGVLLKNKQDVQNMIIGIIFRQQKKYRKEEILKLSMHYFKGSSLSISQEEISNIIDDNLFLLNINGKIECKNGTYTPSNII